MECFSVNLIARGNLCPRKSLPESLQDGESQLAMLQVEITTGLAVSHGMFDNCNPPCFHFLAPGSIPSQTVSLEAGKRASREQAPV